MLFNRGGLEQETGVMKPNYLQEGSSYKVLTFDDVDDEVVYTVSTNKKFYVTSVVVQDSGGDVMYLYDGSSAADPQAVAGGFGNGTTSFSTPIVFETSIYCNCTGNITNVSFLGWEE